MAKKAVKLNPHDTDARLERELSRLMEMCEAFDYPEVTFPQYLNALYNIQRCRAIQKALKKVDHDEPNHVGSAVRKFSTAFQANAGARRAQGTGPADIAAAYDDDDDDHSAA